MADGSITVDTKVNNDGIKSGLSKIGSIAGTALKGTAIAIGSIATAFTGLITASVNARGELEQQVGGVQTLFKNSADTVIKNANNAYKTAGMSAVDYMSTATSFSASLLQSLGGDTEKAAQTTDMAITDMSDNANKMGTSMESIQYAYQGFAKQNYTMLDNLKLGYGGTKDEMQRLLADAQKITGVKYDITNLNDVYNAIHVVQGELGITGTTAKEASQTLQGSIASLKASWENFLSGSGNLSQVVTSVTDVVANIVRIVNEALPQIMQNIVAALPQLIQLGGQLINSIMTGITTYLPQLITSAGQIMQMLLNALITYLPQLLQAGVQIINSLIQGLVQAIPQLMPIIIQAIDLILGVILDNLPLIVSAGLDIIISLIEGIAKMLPELIPTFINCVILITETLLDHLDEIIDAGIDIIIALVQGIIEALPKLIEKMPEIISKLVTKLTEPSMLLKLVEAALQLIIALAEGIIKAIPQLLLYIPRIITNIVDELKNDIKNTDWGKVGKDMIEGLWNGIKNMGNWIKNKVKEFAQGILDKMKDTLGIHSPSTVFRDEIGKNLALGLGEGFDKNLDSVYSDMQKTVDLETNKLNTNLTSGTVAKIVKDDNTQATLNAIGKTEITLNNELTLDGEKVAKSTNKVNKKLNLQYGF